MSRETGRRGTALAPQQNSLLPALFAAPPNALAGAFMANPFEFMNRISSEMDQWFDSFGLGRPSQPGSALSRGTSLRSGGQAGLTWMPQLETFQRGNQLVVRADLPGINKDDLDIRLEDGALVVSGERRQEEEEEQGGTYRSERSYGSFYRAIPLPDGVTEDQISATYRDGVLEVTVPLPRQEQQRGRKISIK